MGNNVTEGAIIQHLAKLRVRRVEKNKQVPPPLRRGGGGGGGGSSSSNGPKSPEAPVTPVSPAEAEEVVRKRHAKKPSIQKVEKKRAASRFTQIPSDSDEEWTATMDKKTKTKRPQKRRKTTPLKSEPGIESDPEFELEPEPEPEAESESEFEPEPGHLESGDDTTDDVDKASHRSDLVAVDAKFLSFLEDDQEKVNDDERASTVSEDEHRSDTKKSLFVTLRPGRENMCRLKYKGIGVYQERDPEQRWEVPAPGLNGQTWGFSRDYYGPIPQSAQHSYNPGILRGDWPQEVIMRQYEAPQAVTWSHETYQPDPRLVHPAHVLDNASCEPQLRFHRKLRAAEESHVDVRGAVQMNPAYQAYVKTHRELPSLATSPTAKLQSPILSNSSNPCDFASSISGSLRTDRSSIGSSQQSQGTSHIDGSSSAGGVDNPRGQDDELLHGKIFAEHTLTEDAVEEAKELIWWQH